MNCCHTVSSIEVMPAMVAFASSTSSTVAMSSIRPRYCRFLRFAQIGRHDVDIRRRAAVRWEWY